MSYPARAEGLGKYDKVMFTIKPLQTGQIPALNNPLGVDIPLNK